MRKYCHVLLPTLVIALLLPITGAGQDAKPADLMSAATFADLKLRSIGPAIISGRVVSLAVDPANRSHFFAAAGSGGVWKTTNGGTTWTPVFDSQSSYSIGAVALDPKNPAIVWVGTGENNSQRSVSYGDGVYRSDDDGKTWTNVGLKASEHIGRIAIDPGHTGTVYVAAQGPLWKPGGDRGVFKTTDSGKTWKNILAISENTGVADVALCPENPDVVFAAAYQRRRHVWTLIDGGPEGAIYKSTDAGSTWNKLKTGLPAGDIGRIGLAISPVDNRIVYATIEAANKTGGIFRSTDYGATWERRNEFDSTAMYYGQVIADPKNSDRIYVPHVFMMVSDDAGKTLRRLGEKSKHVDNHAIWIDPNDSNYYLVGCDGGVYESFDRGENWVYKSNLPLGQFYDVTADNAAPFYNVYGGTQDNFSLGGPSRTRSASGITNADWFVTQGGDGFRSVVDPEDPSTVYAELQHGELVRFDRRTGQRIGIKPREGAGEPPLRWNWDSPIIVSSHSHTRLYFAANKLFRSDDRGDSWRVISGELSRAIDRNQLPVMGKVWGPDAVAKNASTSFYGNVVALAESPRKEGLLYVGTDDGLIRVTENGGGDWRKIETFPGVPAMTYVSRLCASSADPNTVYASFDNHKNGDFAPYLLRSTDAGKTWAAIKSDLPQNGPVLAIGEDPGDSNLLFVGTEFGLFFSPNRGQKWVQLKGGLPTIAVRDLAIQKRENDLIVGTFGRGIYILDDYTSLRGLTPASLDKDGILFPAKDALMYIQSFPYGGRGKSFQGESFFTADNPPFGATFTYYLKDGLKTRRQKRQEMEAAARKNGAVLSYPSVDQLRQEEEEEAPAIFLTVTDSSGKVVRKLTGPLTAGVHRVAWDLRFPAINLSRPPPEDFGFADVPEGPLVMPGTFTVTIAKRIDGVLTPISEPKSFSVTVEGAGSMSSGDRAALVAFQQKVARLQRGVFGAVETAKSLRAQLVQVHQAISETPASDSRLSDQATAIEKKNHELLRLLQGDLVLRSRNENTPPSVADRVNTIVEDQRFSTARPTQTQIAVYAIAAEEFARELSRLKTLVEVDLVQLQKAMEEAGAPWIPGHVPDWKDR